MEPQRHYPQAGFYPPSEPPAQFVTPELVEERPAPPAARGVRRRILLPLVLFVATCATTLLTGASMTEASRRGYPPEWRLRAALLAWQHGDSAFALRQLRIVAAAGMSYAVPLLVILVCHEMGHFVQARRYGVPATWPFFLPMPGSPIGTMGAVIAMDPRYGDRKALFDIGISGPLAGLIPTIVFCVLGLGASTVGPLGNDATVLGDPPLMKILARLLLGDIPPGHDVILTPMAYAGWVGLLITSLNLFPVGQLDGGHVLFGLLGTKAHVVARWVMRGVVAAILIAAFVYGQRGAMGWLLMVFLVFMMGTDHPPTTDDHVPLGGWRHVLGWLTLAFLPLGFTPIPFVR